MTKFDVIGRWLQKAKNDMKIALDELETEGPVLDMVGFHLQQFAEKYLKAYLIYKERNPSKTHSISYLLNLCIEIDPAFKIFLDTRLLELDEFAVEIRYEGGDDIDPDFIKEVIETLKELKRTIEDRLKITE